MIRDLWLRLATCALIAVSLTLPAQEKKDREGRKKATEEGADKEVKGKAGEKAGDKGVAEEGKSKKPDVLETSLQAFRRSQDPDVIEIVALYDEIEKCYAELATARNVASGEDKEARKAEKDVKGLEGRIKRQMRKLEGDVDKYTRPMRKDYEETKRKYDGLREKGDQLSEQKQEKRATGLYQQADRLTGKMEGLKRQLDTAEWFLCFDNAVPIAGLEDGDDDDADGGGRQDRRDKEEFKGFKAEKGEKAEKAEKADKGEKAKKADRD